MPKVVDREVRKAEITRAVIRSLHKVGLANVTIRGISREGAFSSGTLSHYFTSKEEMINFAFDEISNKAYMRIDERVEKCMSARDKIRVVIEELTPQSCDEHDAVISVSFWAAARQDENLKIKFRDVYERLRLQLKGFINDGIESGEFKIIGNIEDEIDFIVAITDGLLVSFLLDPERFPPSRSQWLVDAAMSRLE